VATEKSGSDLQQVQRRLAGRVQKPVSATLDTMSLAGRLRHHIR
jgi:hypothetical protein